MLHLAITLQRAAAKGDERLLGDCLARLPAATKADVNPRLLRTALVGALYSACSSGQLSCARLLLDAGADPRDRAGTSLECTLLHDVAKRVPNGPAMVRMLVAAAPDVLQARDSLGHTPLQAAIHCLGQDNLDTALTLLHLSPQQPAAELLATLRQSRGTPDCVVALYAALVIKQPLSPADWQQVPSPCGALSAALPTVLRRSQAEAALLVAHLPPAAQQRLRTAVLCLARAQRSLPAALPAPLVNDWLALAVAEPEEALLNSASLVATA